MAYRRVLGNSRLARLMAGEFISSIGDWLYLVALLVVVYEVSRDPFALGLVGAARIVPFLAGPGLSTRLLDLYRGAASGAHS